MPTSDPMTAIHPKTGKVTTAQCWQTLMKTSPSRLLSARICENSGCATCMNGLMVSWMHRSRALHTSRNTPAASVLTKNPIASPYTVLFRDENSCAIVYLEPAANTSARLARAPAKLGSQR